MTARRGRTSRLIPALLLAARAAVAAGVAFPGPAPAATPCPDPGLLQEGSLSLGLPASSGGGPGSPAPISLSVANSSPQSSGFALPDAPDGFSIPPDGFQKSGDLEGDCVWIHLEGADPTLRLRLAPHGDVSAHAYLELTLQTHALPDGALTIYFLDHEWKQELAASALVTVPASTLTPGVPQTLSIPLAEFASPVFDDTELTDIVIGVDISGQPVRADTWQRCGGTFSTLSRSWQLMTRQRNAQEQASCDIVIRPHVSDVSFTAFAQVDRLADAGSAATEAVLPQIRRLIDMHTRQANTLRRESVAAIA